MTPDETPLPWLSLVVFAPWLGALVLALWPRAHAAACRPVALLFSVSTLALCAGLLAQFNPLQPGFSFVERALWIGALDVHYHLGLDGLSLLLVLLTGVVAPACVLAAWESVPDPRRFFAWFLFLQGCALGVFLALDFVLWFLFWELSLVPAFFLVRLWGSAGRERAATQFFVFTLAGSAPMLLGFAALYGATGTFNFVELGALGRAGEIEVLFTAMAERTPLSAEAWSLAVFVGLLLGLGVKAPLFPLHTWLPATYAAAPTGVAMFLTGVMSKMGVYGFFRLLWPIFPEETTRHAPWLLALAVAGAVFGAFAALAQRDAKRMLAYSSLNHVSYCLVALFAVAYGAGATIDPVGVAAAFNGAMLQMFNHGVGAAALFFFVGVLEERGGGRRGLDDFGGVRTAAPLLAGLCGLALFSSLGLPGLAGFVGEFLVFRGVFQFAPWAAIAGTFALLATAWFLLAFWRRVFHGPRPQTAPEFPDLSPRESLAVAPCLLLLVIVGVFPQVLLQFANPAAAALASWISLR